MSNRLPGFYIQRPYRARKQKRPRIAGPLMPYANSRLFQRGVDRVEVGAQLRAEAVDGGNDGQRNAGGNQAVFDGGGAGLVLHETRDKVLHQTNSMYTWLVELVLVSRRSQHRDHVLTLKSEHCSAVNSIE